MLQSMNVYAKLRSEKQILQTIQQLKYHNRKDILIFSFSLTAKKQPCMCPSIETRYGFLMTNVRGVTCFDL